MKTYNNEKAIISLTSWKKRINTVSKTIFSLLKQCPGFHIVLVLSEEEFPKKEEELPADLMAIVNNDLIEILWVYKNYKSFKKAIFTMDKYRTVPVISADDGQVYTENFAEKLYQLWTKNKRCICATTLLICKGVTCGYGSTGILYPPYCFLRYGKQIIEEKYSLLKKNPNDDRFIGCLAYYLKIKYKSIHKPHFFKFNNVIIESEEKNGMTKNKVYKIGTNWIFPEIIRSYFNK